jgi:branched-chain amino acid transport system ATP-binding protein
MLRVDRVTKRFGGLTAVSGISFHMQAGQIMALIGPNGAGKTTLLNIVSNFYHPDEGQVLLEGRLLTGLAAHKVAARGVGRTFQHVQLAPEVSVLENVMVGGHLRGSKGLLAAMLKTPAERREERTLESTAHDALDFVGIAHLAGTLVRNLPYGSQRLVELARALSGSPKLLLLDEPAAGLNDAETAELGRLIRKIRDRGITVLLVEHSMPLVMAVAEFIVVLNFGEKIADGSPDEVRTNPTVIAAYLGGGVENARA